MSLLGGTWSFTETGDTDSATIGLNEIKRMIDGKIDFSFIEADRHLTARRGCAAWRVRARPDPLVLPVALTRLSDPTRR